MTAAAKKAENPTVVLHNQIEAMTPQFAAALPEHVRVERFKRIALTAILGNPDLMGADRRTLFESCVKCAQDGLLPDGREAALVIYKGRVQYLPMVAGILKKVRNSGELATITSQVVYKGDTFRYWVDEDGEHVEYSPEMFGDRGDIVGAFALAKLKDGAVYVEPMTKIDIEKARAASSSKNGPWSQWWSEMARKTVIKRLAKRLPQSTDLDRMLAVDADDETIPPRPRLADFQSPLDALPAPEEEAIGDDGLTDIQRATIAQYKDQLGDIHDPIDLDHAP